MPKRSTRLADLAFDIRSVIGGLFLVYGLVCLIWGLVSFPPEAAEKTGGINLNLWAGLGMLALGAVFVGWVLAKPLSADAGEPVDATADAAGAADGTDR